MIEFDTDHKDYTSGKVEILHRVTAFSEMLQTGFQHALQL